MSRHHAEHGTDLSLLKPFFYRIHALLTSGERAQVEQGLELLQALDEPVLWSHFAYGIHVHDEQLVITKGPLHCKVNVRHKWMVLFAVARGAGLLATMEAITFREESLTDSVVLDTLAGLSGLRSLQFLYCPQIQSLDALPVLPGLRRVVVRGCPTFQRIGDHIRCPGVQQLALPYCSRLRSLKGIQAFCNLQTLSLRGCNPFTELDVLAELPQLHTLDLRGVRVPSDLKWLEGLKSLRRLDLSHNTGLLSLANFPMLPALEELDLRGCDELKGLERLSHLPALKTARYPTLPRVRRTSSDG